MNRIIIFVLGLIVVNPSFSQQLLMSWSQRNISNYTKEMYDHAQKLSPTELLEKNLNDKYWSEVFLTLNASINNYSKDTSYLKGLAQQITNNSETKLEGTSRLIIWDRITSGEILFEGKGIVFENDLFKVCGRANQILQNVTNKSFGIVSINTSEEELEDLKSKWLKLFDNEEVAEYQPEEYLNAQIPEISNLSAVQALISSLKSTPAKEEIITSCLKNLYDLDKMPEESDSPARFCDPDTYTLSYLGILFGDEKTSNSKDAEWWLEFWEQNNNSLVWNKEGGIFIVKN